MYPDDRLNNTEGGSSESSYQPEGAPSPYRRRIVLPFEHRPKDLGTWTYEHKVGLCVMIIAYLLFGIVFVSTKLVISVPEQENTIYLDMVPTPPEPKTQLTPEEKQQMEQDVSNAHNAISNESAKEVAEKQIQRVNGGAMRGANDPIPQKIADEADAVAKRMQASKAAYEKGLREEQEMINAHNAGKRSKDNKQTKQKDVKIAGNVLISFSLAGRTFVYMHTPAYQCEGSGQVVVEIAVNRNGKVTSASIRSVTSQEECLIDRALESARLSRFNVDASAPASQTGTITYLFQRQ